jgi:hypothetical protein
MPAWTEINQEIDSLSAPNAHDLIRKKYLKELAAKTGRPVIAYYSGFLWKKDKEGRFHAECAISDLDMNGFMAVIHGLPRGAGLDLILHTPGGGIEPQIRGFAAMGILAEVDRAMDEIKQNPMKQILWQQVFSKYPPAFISDCERSVEGARTMVKEWLEQNMLSAEPDPHAAAETVVSKLMDYSGTTEHSHHFLIDKCADIGLRIDALEQDQGFQEGILSVHHCYMASFARSNSLKIIDNSNDETWIVDVTP